MKCIFLFNGWGMDASIFPHRENLEVISYPYDVKEALERHEGEELIALAWSFGAYYFAKLPKEVRDLFTKKIAINGLPETLGPYGILPKMCRFTYDTLTKETLLAFYRNMDFPGEVRKDFSLIKEELGYFLENYEPQENCFDFAWISKEDRIFSAKKLERYYKKEGVDYAFLEGGHFPFQHYDLFQI